MVSDISLLKENDWRLPSSPWCLLHQKSINRVVEHKFDFQQRIKFWQRLLLPVEIILFITKNRSSVAPSFIQSTWSSGGWATTGQVTTPSIPVGRYVSGGIFRACAGSVWRMKIKAIYFGISTISHSFGTKGNYTYWRRKTCTMIHNLWFIWRTDCFCSSLFPVCLCFYYSRYLLYLQLTKCVWRVFTGLQATVKYSEEKSALPTDTDLTINKSKSGRFSDTTKGLFTSVKGL